MMLTNCILITLLSALGAPQSPSPMTWESDYGTALEQCREASKPLLIVLDNPADAQQCLTPEWLESNGLADYELCHVDVTTEYGQRVAEVFGAKSFPHVAVIDRSGSVILGRLSGEISHAAWLTTLSRHKQGLRRSETLVHQVAKPVVESNYSPIVTPSTDHYVVPSQVYSPKPYCPSCQLHN